jgi:hypothetical protein
MVAPFAYIRMLLDKFYAATADNARRLHKPVGVRTEAKIEDKEKGLGLITLSFDNLQSRE